MQRLDRPQSSDSAACGLRSVTDNASEGWSHGPKLAVANRLPREMALGEGLAPEHSQELALAQPGKVRHWKRLLVVMSNAPDPSATLVTLRVIPRHFIVG